MSSKVFDFSAVAAQLVGDKKFSRIEGACFAIEAARAMYTQVFAQCEIQIDPDDDAKFYAEMVTAILGGEAVEVRLYRDLLDPDTCASFDNEIPEVIWEEVKAQAKKYLASGEITNTRVIKHLRDLSEGKIEVPIHTKNWRQWISLNAAVLLEEDHLALLAEALQVNKLSAPTQNFLRSIKKL